MKFLKWPSFFVLTTAGIVFGLIYFHPGIRFYVETLERYRSKEVCSCHLSIERDLDKCKKDWEVVSWIPYLSKVSKEIINQKEYQSITVGILRKKSIYLGKNDGCRMIN